MATNDKYWMTNENGDVINGNKAFVISHKDLIKHLKAYDPQNDSADPGDNWDTTAELIRKHGTARTVTPNTPKKAAAKKAAPAKKAIAPKPMKKGKK